MDPSTLPGDHSDLYLNENSSDVVLVVGGVKLHAHKEILSTRSEYFKSLFSRHSKQIEISIADTEKETFEHLLKYIYTGKITFPSDIESKLNMLGLAHRYIVKDLELTLLTKLQSMLNMKTVGSILNGANLYDLKELRDICHNYMDFNAPEVLENGCLSNLTQKSMIELLKRDTFAAPETAIYEKVADWCARNSPNENVMKKCVRLAYLDVEELLTDVWPSKLVRSDDVLQAIAEIFKVRALTARPRTKLIFDENVATAQHRAEVISGDNTSDLLNGNGDYEKYAEIGMDGHVGFIIKFHTATYLNHINMMLWDQEETRYYSYFVELSLDLENWERIVDYTEIPCRSVQNLYFLQQIAQYIKIGGTDNSHNDKFHLIYVEAYFKTVVPEIVNGILSLETNVASPEMKAIVLKGENPQFLLNGDTGHYDCIKGFTYHVLNKNPPESIIVQLAQPFMISKIKLLLWDQDERSYKYFVETSINNRDWEMAVDRRNDFCRSWQNLRFERRAAVFIKITGTHNTENNALHCVHFECSA